MSHELTARDVQIIVNTAKSQKARTRRQAWFLLALTDQRLRQATRNELQLAADVRLPLAAVVSLLWKVRKVAKAQWNALSTPDARAAAEDQLVTAGVRGELYYAPLKELPDDWQAAKAAAKAAAFEAQYDLYVVGDEY